MSGSSRVVRGRLQQHSWTAEGGSARSVLEVATEELGPNLGAILDVVQLVP
jgi:single-stranded DNA-binding protein